MSLTKPGKKPSNFVLMSIKQLKHPESGSEVQAFFEKLIITEHS